MKNITNEIVKRFEQYLYEEEKSDNTIEKYMRDIRFFREWLGGKGVDKSVVLAYKKELCEKYLPASVNSVLSSLNSFFTFNEWYNLRVKNLKIQRQTFANKDNETGIGTLLYNGRELKSTKSTNKSQGQNACCNTPEGTL